MLDRLIKNGLVFDGYGLPPIVADVGIQDGKIVTIAPAITTPAHEIPAHEIIDATGLWVIPGFIDIHTHYDLEVEIAPGLSESVRHGVTSVVIGNCSLSVAIGEPQMLADIFQRVETLSHRLIEKWLATSVSWQSPAEYLQHLQQLPLGPNVAVMFGHSALRAHVMGLERSLTQPPTDRELATMHQIATAALDAGFIGISIDMFPWHIMSGEWCGYSIPSQHAEWREYTMLADLCRERDRVFQVTPNIQRLRSFFEILYMGCGGWGRRNPLRITVLSALDAVHNRQLWRLFPPLLWVWHRLLGGNARFQTLTEPFTIYSNGPVTPLFEEFPTGVQLNSCATRADRQALLNHPAFQQRFRQDWTRRGLKSFHRRLELMTIVDCPDRPDWQGLSFVDIAQNHDPLDYFIQLLATYDTDLRWVATGANDRLQPRLAMMRHPHILPGFTDAGAHVRNLGYYDGALSLLKQAVTTKFLTPQAAIQRVTGEPAQWFGLDTGVIKVGAQADLVLIEPIALHQPLSPPIEISDPLLDGEPRMVKRGSGEIIRSVYIKGVRVVDRGTPITTELGQKALGQVLQPVSTPKFSTPKSSAPKRRDRISAAIPDHPFTDYWDVFVLKHQHPVNIGLHILGILIFYGLLGAAWFWQQPKLLLALPLTQLVGLLGHWGFERSHIDRQDAILSWRASWCLGKLLWRLAIGQYPQDIQQRQAILRDYQLGRPTALK
jgi:N-acyl-D-aspartate/D-glutamate deacylase